jgi:hypothetical protein
MFDTKNIPTIRDLMSNIDLEFLAWLSGGLSILDAACGPGVSNGGADRDRTGGLLVANQALSQLSYSPNRDFQFAFLVSSTR